MRSIARTASSWLSTGRVSARWLVRFGNATQAATSRSITPSSFIMRMNVLAAAKRRSHVAGEILHPHNSFRHASIVSLVISCSDSIAVSFTSHRTKNITPRS